MSRSVRWVPVLTVVVLLGAGMLAAASSVITFGHRPPVSAPPPVGGDDPAPVSEAPGSTLRPPELDERPSILPRWLGSLLAALCAAAAVVLFLVLLWVGLRDRLTVTSAPAVGDPEEMRRKARERVRAAVDEGLSDLDVDDGDPRRAVIACWARLEAAAAAAGTPREPGHTSTDLVQRLLAEHAITAPVLAGFAAVFREARFATHVVDEAMRDQARAALRQIRDELVAGVRS